MLASGLIAQDWSMHCDEVDRPYMVDACVSHTIILYARAYNVRIRTKSLQRYEKVFEHANLFAQFCQKCALFIKYPQNDTFRVTKKRQNDNFFIEFVRAGTFGTKFVGLLVCFYIYIHRFSNLYVSVT